MRGDGGAGEVIGGEEGRMEEREGKEVEGRRNGRGEGDGVGGGRSVLYPILLLRGRDKPLRTGDPPIPLRRGLQAS